MMSRSLSTTRKQRAFSRAIQAWIVSLIGALAIAITLMGCSDDGDNGNGNGNPGGPVGGAPSPEQLVINMAQSMLSNVINKELDELLFPSDSIDYETLMEDFLAATQQLLDQQTINEQEGYVNGEMANLYELDVRFAATDPSDTTGINDIYNQVVAEEGDVNETLGVLEQYPQQSLSGWMSGAQVKLNYLALEIELNAIRNPTNLAVQSDMATTLSEFIEYATATRNQIIYANLLKSVQRVSSCENTNPCNNSDDCSDEYTDCNGNSHLYKVGDYSNPKQACESARFQDIQQCGDTVYNSQTVDLTWLQQVVTTWQQTLAGMATEVAAVDQPCAICQDAYSTLTIDSVTYASDSTGASSAPRDATSWLAASCNGLQTCDYELKREDFNFSGNFAFFEVLYRCGSDPTQRNLMIAGAGNPLLQEGAYVHLDCAPTVTNLQASFRGEPIVVGSNDGDISSFSASPDATKLNDGLFAANGAAYNDPTYALVFARTGTGVALILDLGRTYELKYAQIQADSNDVYHVDYSNDRINWAPWFDFPKVSASGLQTRSSPSSFITARYLRVYPTSGDGKYGVSELRPYNSNALSYEGVSTGPEPLITNGEYAPAGTAYNDVNYATVFSGVGAGAAQIIDFKTLRSGLDRVQIQVEGDASYQLDVSADRNSWFSWYAFPIGSSGLQIKNSGTITAPVAARYVRIYPIAGNGKYSVAEVQVFANLPIPPCTGLRVCNLSVADHLQNLAGGTPSAQDLQDFVVNWTCGSDTTAHTAHAVPWSGSPSLDAAVVQIACPASPVTCVAGHPTTCTAFREDADDAVVYAQAAHISYPLCMTAQASCAAAIASRTNYYHTDPSSAATHNNPACENVQMAIADEIAAGACPPGIGASSSNSYTVWPYSVSISGGSTTTCLTDPALNQPPVLAFVACNSLIP